MEIIPNRNGYFFFYEQLNLEALIHLGQNGRSTALPT